MARAALNVKPANAASWDDLRSIFDTRGDRARCWCQRFKLAPRESFGRLGPEELAFRLRQQTDCGHPTSGHTSGLVAYLDGVPVGWCAVEPGPAYEGLVRVFKVPWAGREEDRDDDAVWAVTCLLTRADHRGRGVSGALVAAAVSFARGRGARALEAYPMTDPDATTEERHVGTVEMFRDAGLVEVGRPTKRRAVMRIELRP